jgi:spermidine/putrescine transport system substrate-binding protein
MKASTRLAAMLITAAASATAEEINALVWCDHTDPAFIQPCP